MATLYMYPYGESGVILCRHNAVQTLAIIIISIYDEWTSEQLIEKKYKYKALEKQIKKHIQSAQTTQINPTSAHKTKQTQHSAR